MPDAQEIVVNVVATWIKSKIGFKPKERDMQARISLFKYYL